MSKKILVTGATGNVGSDITKKLAERDDNVRAAVRNPVKAREMDLGDAMLVHFDYTKPSSFDMALEGVEKLVLIAPPATPNADELLTPVIDTAKKKGVKHIVLHSAMGVDANDEIPMRKAELYLENSGIDYTIVRPNWFNQNFSSWMTDTIKQGAIYAPAEQAETSFIDTRDIADVIVTALHDAKHKNKAYTLTGPEQLTYADVASKISEATGKEVKYQPISDEDFRGAMMNMGYDEANAEMMSGLFQFVRAGYNAPVNDEVKKITGHDPIPFGQYAKDFADTWK